MTFAVDSNVILDQRDERIHLFLDVILLARDVAELFVFVKPFTPPLAGGDSFVGDVLVNHLPEHAPHPIALLGAGIVLDSIDSRAEDTGNHLAIGDNPVNLLDAIRNGGQLLLAKPGLFVL